MSACLGFALVRDFFKLNDKSIPVRYSKRINRVKQLFTAVRSKLPQVVSIFSMLFDSEIIFSHTNYPGIMLLLPDPFRNGDKVEIDGA